MTAALRRPSTHTGSSPLEPIAATLAAIRVRRGDAMVHGISPELVVDDERGWTPATELVSGERLDDLLGVAKQRWSATDHVAAALAWKCYTYWLALPAVIGYAAGRVPSMGADNVYVRYTDHQPFLTMGLRRPDVTVLASDPLAVTPDAPGIRVASDDGELRRILRETLLDAHLTPLLDEIRGRVRLGRRTLLGSLASGMAHALSRAADALPGSTLELANTVLSTLDVADLVELRARANGELDVQRRTCCLAFTLPEPKVCVGCCIRGA